MLPGQMLPKQLESVLEDPRSLQFKFGQNRASNSWDIADFEFSGGGSRDYMVRFQRLFGVQSHFNV